MNQWNKTLNEQELTAHYALTNSIDPRFAAAEKAFYESRTVNELRALATQAWNCNEATAYQLARSYLIISA